MLELVILTGLSGAGKTKALSIFNDNGYYAIDNVPLDMFTAIIETSSKPSSGVSKLVLSIDVRTRGIENAYKVIDKEKTRYNARVVYLECDKAVLINRFKESRRMHPRGVIIGDAIDEEITMLAPIREFADVIIDTSDYSPHDLQSRLQTWVERDNRAEFQIVVQSFGFKYGSPRDSDMLMDVRFLKNPYFVPELRGFSGQNADVSAYIQRDDFYEPFMTQLFAMLDLLVPRYINEMKSSFTLSIGCTGGRHRSVHVAESVGTHLTDLGYNCLVKHMDMDRTSAGAGSGAGSGADSVV